MDRALHDGPQVRRHLERFPIARIIEQHPDDTGDAVDLRDNDLQALGSLLRIHARVGTVFGAPANNAHWRADFMREACRRGCQSSRGDRNATAAVPARFRCDVFPADRLGPSPVPRPTCGTRRSEARPHLPPAARRRGLIGGKADHAARQLGQWARNISSNCNRDQTTISSSVSDAGDDRNPDPLGQFTGARQPIVGDQQISDQREFWRSQAAPHDRSIRPPGPASTRNSEAYPALPRRNFSGDNASRSGKTRQRIPELPLV